MEDTLSSYFVLCGNHSHHSSILLIKVGEKVSEIIMAKKKTQEQFEKEVHEKYPQIQIRGNIMDLMNESMSIAILTNMIGMHIQAIY